jgi:hypothetical protein
MNRAMRLLPPLLVLAACSAACSSSTDTSSVGTFPMTVTSDSGSLRVELTSTPNPPVVGTNSVEITVTRASDGATQEGLSLDVVPWMPAMQHGTSTPTVTAEGGGKYLVSDLYFFMAGTWVLRTTFSGPVSDHAEPTFELQ